LPDQAIFGWRFVAVCLHWDQAIIWLHQFRFWSPSIA
jgi:hypothetical protein